MAANINDSQKIAGERVLVDNRCPLYHHCAIFRYLLPMRSVYNLPYALYYCKHVEKCRWGLSYPQLFLVTNVGLACRKKVLCSYVYLLARFSFHI